ncbi:MAG: PcfJ domain-containing protein [Campylobacterota bacterium]|nr:PcfJ domain-containing protein [Campylobacterota bacterium]
MNIPNSIDLSCDEIGFISKEIFKITIDEIGQVNETLFANFDLDRLKDEEQNYFIYSSSQDDLINKHPILLNYKTKILKNILKNNYFEFSDDITKKTKKIEQVGYFAKYNHLKEFDFYHWKNVDFLPSNQKLTVNEALKYVVNYRKEKSLKKAIFEYYQEQMVEGKYYFLYPFCVAKYIKDVNIAIRLLLLDFNHFFTEIIDHNSLEYFLQYLTKNYSDKQIENLLKSYLKQEMFWFLDSLDLFAELNDEMRDNFMKVSCRYDALHDEIVSYHRLIMEQKLLDTKYIYTNKQNKANITIESYTVKLPITGKELYDWATRLHNCMAGYSSLIEQCKTTIYGFFKNEQIIFAVEIKNGKIVEARAKYNEELSKEQMNIVFKWYEEHILKKKEDT